MQTFAIDLKVPKKYDHILIEPISDVHRDDINFVKPKWDEVIERIRKEPNRFTIGMGDYGSQIYTSMSERRGPETIVDEFKDNPMLLYQTLVDELSPIKSKILLILQGNHDHTVEKYSHINPVKDLLADPLGVRYGSYVSLVSLRVTNGIKTQTWKFYLTHGKVTGQMPSSSLGKIERMAQGFDADIYLAGDRHDIIIDKRLYYSVSDDGKLLRGTKIYGVCGCFVEGYSDSKTRDGRTVTSYPELIMGLPNRVGTLTIQLNLDSGKINAHE